MSGRSHPRPPARRPPGWQCRCHPILSRRTNAAASVVVMLHAPTCDLPADRRRPVVMRFVRRQT
jgi:hypothetical protein